MTGFHKFAPWVSAEAAALFAAEAAAPAAPPPGDIASLRRHYDAFNRRHLAVALARYPVDTVRSEIAGVAVDIVTPADIDVDHRTLLCLHGGAFMWGGGAGALLEAVPVAVAAGMRVIAVEYALAPEQVFPAAVNDVLAVYRALCGTQPARSIGLYGCSAGGALTAQTTARIIAEGGLLPGALAMLHGTGLDMLGDSRASAAFLTGADAAPDAPNLAAMPYFAGASADDPLVFPGDHTDVLAKFPPSLLVTGTRDFAASSITVMHRRLRAAGADASLLHFDGMGHAHHMATTLPESRETFAALARHFGDHLA
ncbi:MAG: alpha/beta hydrolase fold domain-containing protein [Sphingopyxis sp.]|nr:alpha/beta hydrolase fold domain-containing protein [Sphingopyxis sp.]